MFFMHLMFTATFYPEKVMANGLIIETTTSLMQSEDCLVRHFRESTLTKNRCVGEGHLTDTSLFLPSLRSGKKNQGRRRKKSQEVYGAWTLLHSFGNSDRNFLFLLLIMSSALSSSSYCLSLLVKQMIGF